MRQIVPTAIVLLAISGIPARAQSIGLKAPQRLSVAVDGPAKPVAPGEQFSLSVRIVPNQGIHVYAPGNPENIPVSISLTPPAGLAVDPAKFPKAEDFFFGPTAETLKVYTKPFVVSVPMRVESGAAAPAAREVTVTGAVRYQACNDRVCFPPQSAPFEARVALSTERH
jgi:DsbC/DsbD-like thiol-disulfide interchange protein